MTVIDPEPQILDGFRALAREMGVSLDFDVPVAHLGKNASESSPKTPHFRSLLTVPMNQATNSRSDKSPMPLQKKDYPKERDFGAESISGQPRRSRETTSRSASDDGHRCLLGLSASP